MDKEPFDPERPCRGCVPPKRHPGCHDSCPDWLPVKARHDAAVAAERRDREIKTEYYGVRRENPYARKMDRDRRRGRG